MESIRKLENMKKHQAFLPSGFSSNLAALQMVSQGPLKKWTEHSQELHLLKIYSRGAPITLQGWMGVDFLDFFLSSLELIF